MSARVPARVLFLGMFAMGFLTWGMPGAFAAQEQPSGISFSVGGEEFSAEPQPLFESHLQLVPGDQLTDELSIRNDRDHDITVSVTPRLSDTSTELQFEVMGQASAQLEPHQASTFQLRVRLPESAGNSSQNQTRDLAVEVRAVQTGDVTPPGTPPAPPQDPDADPSAPPHELGNTGFDGWIFALAGGVLGVGTILFLRSKKSRPASQTQQGEPS
ncbi:hypothetical protein [Glutamicibacter sp. NPDC087344]|uniref:hypothetical protein n=1 Tax=Glutamicibacter sp. NPDC087344 TaxID=3363994 RepID=UPI003826EAA0